MIFLGCLFDREKEKEYLAKSRSGLSNAANGFQWNLIEGLKANNEKLTIMNVLPVGTFPQQYKQFILKNHTWMHQNETNYEIGCVNLPFIKQYQRYLGTKKFLRKSEDKNIVVYSAYEPFLKAVHKLDSSYCVTVVITDLPEYYDLGKTNALRRVLRKRNNRKIEKYLKRADQFVLLTKQMKEPLAVGDRPYVVVEGICNSQMRPVEASGNEKVILYTGTLHERFGIKTLLEAFAMIEDDNVRLWICGSGDAEAAVKAAEQKDPRIKFYGYVTKEQVEDLQQQATVLVNPRGNAGEFTKYSFPSKTMEYMLSGKPVVMHKLAGVPDEYDPFLCYIENDSPESLKAALLAVCQMEPAARMELGRKAAQFVAQTKNAEYQAKRILEMIRQA